MSEIRRFGLVDALLLLLVIAGAAGTRSWYLCVCGDNANFTGPLRVQEPYPPLPTSLAAEEGTAPATELDALVTALKEQRGLSGPAPFAAEDELTAHLSPGYPYLLFFLELIPVDLGPRDRTVRWIQCGLGALTAALYFLFALRAFGDRFAATLAGLFCAVYPFWVINTAEINDGVVTCFGLAACVYFGSRAGDDGGPLSSLLLGLFLAGLSLMRAAMLPFAFVALLWFLYRCRLVPRGWLSALLALLGFVIGLSPWAIHTYKYHHDVIPVVDSTFLHLYTGNHPGATGGPRTDAEVLQAYSDWRGEPLETLSEELAGLPQAQRYLKFGPPTLDAVRADPLSAVERRYNAASFFLFSEHWFRDRQPCLNDPSGGGGMPEWLAANYPVILFGSLTGMFALALLGWRWTYGWRLESMPSALALMWVPVPYILGHVGHLHGPRLPLDGILLTYAAFALVCLIPVAGGWLLHGSERRPE